MRPTPHSRAFAYRTMARFMTILAFAAPTALAALSAGSLRGANKVWFDSVHFCSCLAIFPGRILYRMTCGGPRKSLAKGGHVHSLFLVLDPNLARITSRRATLRSTDLVLMHPTSNLQGRQTDFYFALMSVCLNLTLTPVLLLASALR